VKIFLVIVHYRPVSVNFAAAADGVLAITVTVPGVDDVVYDVLA
jgi:hypothetical protein